MTSLMVETEPTMAPGPERYPQLSKQPSPHLLLVEDNPGDVWLLREAFRECGFSCEISIIDKGDMVLAFLQRQGKYQRVRRPDLVLLDLHLPGRSGHEVLERMKLSEELRRIPVVVLTSSDNPHDVERAYRNQASGFIPKPSEMEGYLDVVNSVRQYWFQTVIRPRETAGRRQPEE
jgi:two-component system, chemotaxis family, response regulator Rcp1